MRRELQESERRVECQRCGRPLSVCYCAHVVSLPTTTRVLVLQHPREHEKAVGTARIAALCLPNARVAVGVDFRDHSAVREWLDDHEQPAVVLYPGDGAKDIHREPPQGPVTLVVVDGTWHHARRILRKNPWLASLPRYAFTPEKPSEYRIRREPQADYVSTIEALATTLGVLEGDPARFAQLLAPFHAMVSTQLLHAEQSTGARRRTRRRANNPARSRLPRDFALERLVCLNLEANAWPYDRAAQRALYPDELVHLTAHRLRDGACFEAAVAPRQPLAPSTMRHTRLSESILRGGLMLSEAAKAWARFLEPSDVLCAWGTYGLNLLRREGLVLPEAQIDLRKVLGDVRRQRPGSLEDTAHSGGLRFVALGAGRGGERLGMLVAAARDLAARVAVQQASLPFEETPRPDL